MGTTVLAWLAFVVGALMVVTTVLSAIMTLVVPGRFRPDGHGYMLLFWTLGERPLRRALVLSGSSIYTSGSRRRWGRGRRAPQGRPGAGVARLRRLAVNYDRVPPALAALAMAPYAPWSSDRSMIEPGRAGLTGPTPVHHSGMGRM